MLASSALISFAFTYLAIVLLLVVLMVIATWKIFTKAGEAGWKSLIPVYSQYIMYRLSWKTSMFWILLACSIAYNVILGVVTSQLAVTAYIFLLGITINSLIQCLKLSKVFGHGTGFGLGLFFLSPIFLLILGLGGSQYLGNPDA